MDWLYSILESSEMPLLSAIILGLMTAISPCPLATNITAIGYLSKNIESKRGVFIKGLIYTLGRAITYTSLGVLFFFGASQVKISGFIQTWGERILGPLLIIIGLFMLEIFRLSFPGVSSITKRMETRSRKNLLGALMLGVVFALAFCPYSGVLYFGMLIPLTISSVGGLWLPLVFAIATAIPVVVFAWFVAYSMQTLGKTYNKIKLFEKWFRRVVALLFIGSGIYLTLIQFI